MEIKIYLDGRKEFEGTVTTGKNAQGCWAESADGLISAAQYDTEKQAVFAIMSSLIEALWTRY